MTDTPDEVRPNRRRWRDEAVDRGRTPMPEHFRDTVRAARDEAAADRPTDDPRGGTA